MTVAELINMEQTDHCSAIQGWLFFFNYKSHLSFYKGSMDSPLSGQLSEVTSSLRHLKKTRQKHSDFKRN